MPRSGDVLRFMLSSGPPPADNGTVKHDGFTAWEKLCGGAAIATFVGAFLPWATVLGASVAGTSGDGQITVFCATIGLSALTAYRGVGPLHIGPRLTLGIESATGGLVALVSLLNVGPGSRLGVYLTLLAGSAWVAGVVIGWRSGAAVADTEPWYG